MKLEKRFVSKILIELALYTGGSRNIDEVIEYIEEQIKAYKKPLAGTSD